MPPEGWEAAFLSELRGARSELTQQILKLTEQVSKLSGMVSGQSVQIEMHSKEIGRLETTYHTLDERVDMHGHRLDAMESRAVLTGRKLWVGFIGALTAAATLLGIIVYIAEHITVS